MKRAGRLAPRSQKRIDEAEARRACVEAVFARDRVCQFFPQLSDYMRITPADLRKHAGLPPCWGDLTGHEPAHRRNVDYLDPVNVIALCVRHNGFLEDCTGIWRQHAEGCGLLVRGNGKPLRGRVSELTYSKTLER